MRFTNMSQSKVSANLLVPVRENRRRSTVSFLAEDTEAHAVARIAVNVENTYQLQPAEKLSGRLVKAIMRDEMAEKLGHIEHYDAEMGRNLTAKISDSIKNRLKDYLVHRYRLVCVVHIAELCQQSLIITSRCLWNPEFDNYWSYEYKNQHLCAVATVYSIYLE